jgi:hypothetical protein
MRLVAEARQEDPELSMHQAVLRIGSRVGVNADTILLAACSFFAREPTRDCRRSPRTGPRRRGRSAMPH